MRWVQEWEAGRDYNDPWDQKTALGRDDVAWGDDTLVGAGSAPIGHNVVREISLPSSTDTEPVCEGARYGHQNHDGSSHHDEDTAGSSDGVYCHHISMPSALSFHFFLVTDSEDDVGEFGVKYFQRSQCV